jgi:hypothetical protein
VRLAHSDAIATITPCGWTPPQPRSVQHLNFCYTPAFRGKCGVQNQALRGKSANSGSNRNDKFLSAYLCVSLRLCVKVFFFADVQKLRCSHGWLRRETGWLQGTDVNKGKPHHRNRKFLLFCVLGCVSLRLCIKVSFSAVMVGHRSS